MGRVNKQVCNHGRWAKKIQRGAHCNKHTHTSNHVPTTHFHGNSRTSRSQTTRLDVPTTCTSKRCGYHTMMTMVRSQLGGTHPRAPTLELPRYMQKNSAGRFTSNLHVDRLDKFAITTALDKHNPKLAFNTSRLVPDAKIVVSRSLKRSNTLPSDVSNLEKNLVCWKINCRKCPRSNVKPARITSASTSPWSACTVHFGPDDGVVELQVPASRVGHQEYGGKQASEERLIGANCRLNCWDTPIRHQSLLALTTRILYITLMPNSTILTSQFFPVTPA